VYGGGPLMKGKCIGENKRKQPNQLKDDRLIHECPLSQGKKVRVHIMAPNPCPLHWIYILCFVLLSITSTKVDNLCDTPFPFLEPKRKKDNEHKKHGRRYLGSSQEKKKKD
jgi:hypothetical protein